MNPETEVIISKKILRSLLLEGSCPNARSRLYDDNIKLADPGECEACDAARLLYGN